MPVLPHILSRSADTRILDSRPYHAVLSHLPRILPRQVTGIYIATQYDGLNTGPAPGTVAGIVLGSVAGFLFLLWLLWVLSNSNTGFIRSTNLTEEDVVVRRRSRSRGTRRSRRTEMASRSPRRERVIRQERIIRDSVPPPREHSRIREVLVDEIHRSPPIERRVEGDDIVEVIEEHSSVGVPPPRRKSRRSSGGYRREDYSDY